MVAESKESQHTHAVVNRAANDSSGWRLHRWHVWLLIAGLLFRIGFCLMTSKTSALAEVDGREHLAYAQSLLALRWDNYPRYFNCIRPPLYPIFLIPFIAVNDQVVWHIQLAQSVIGVLLAIVLAVIACRWAAAGRKLGLRYSFVPSFSYLLLCLCAHRDSLYGVALVRHRLSTTIKRSFEKGLHQLANMFRGCSSFRLSNASCSTTISCCGGSLDWLEDVADGQLVNRAKAHDLFHCDSQRIFVTCHVC